MAEAVQEIYPGTQVTIGPVIENGFYYDFAREEPFTPEDLPKIESKMREIVARDRPFTCEVVDRKKAKDLFKKKGEAFKVELIDAIPEGEEIKLYSQGDWLDLCRGPHMTSTGKVGKGFKLLKIAGAVLARRFIEANAPAHLRHGVGERGGACRLPPSARRGREARPPAPWPRDGPVPFPGGGAGAVFWHPKGWALFTALIGYMRRRQNAWGYVEVNSPDMMERTLWEQSGHWEKFGDHMYVTETPDERIYAASR
jgi:threonyl-tRNA synthetase